MRFIPTLSKPVFIKKASIYDIPVILGVFGLIYAFMHVGRAMVAPVEYEKLEIGLDFWNVPYYMLRSTARMFIAYGFSLLFTFTYGSAAAHSKRAEKILMPLLDILQSVPVLGFLSATLTTFVALFPGSILGMEIASIFAIFTSQAWNMAYSFYQSVRSIPRDLSEAAQMMRFTRFQRFVRLEIPFAMNGLIWNSMVSFGSGWFFLAASEAITVLGQDIRLPGIGSYLATAIEKGDTIHMCAAIIAMSFLVIALDFLFFRPLLAWSQKFNVSFEGFSDFQRYESAVLTAINRSTIISKLREKLLESFLDIIVNRLPANVKRKREKFRFSLPQWIKKTMLFGVSILALILLVVWAWNGVVDLITSIYFSDILDVAMAGCATLLRVFATVLIASLIWVPLGVYIGFRQSLALKLRPIIQITAAFPSNLVFPFLVLVFDWINLDISFGSVILMVIANQWYILSNIIVGTMAIPDDFKEVMRILRLSRWQRFTKVILPMLLPYWVTGAITSAGGAWNVSIVAEVASFGEDKLECFGLGSYMTEATTSGHWPHIILSIIGMSMFVVVTNRLVWRPLFRYAEERIRED